MYYFIVIAVVLFADRAAKLAVLHFMTPNTTMPLIQDVLHFSYIQNTGAAFSILHDKQMFLICMTSVIMLILILFLVFKRSELSRMASLGIALIIGGGIGNIIDRIIYRYVIDFIDFRFWPVFNVADISIVCGCITVMLYILFFDRKRQVETENENSDKICDTGADNGKH